MNKYTDNQFLAIQLVTKIIDFYDLKQKNRKRELVDIRRVLYHFLCVKHRITYTDVARLFDKDHATVIHSLRDYDLIKKDEGFIRNTSIIREMLNRELGHINKFRLTLEVDINARTFDDAQEYADRIASVYNGKIIEIKEL